MIGTPFAAVALFVASPAPSATPSSVPSLPPEIAVRGQLLALRGTVIVLTTGDALRLHPGTALPARATLGSALRLRIDTATGDVIAVDPAPAATAPGDIDASAVPRRFVVVSSKSAPLPAPSGITVGAAAAHSLLSVTIDVRVPADTPPSDDVYVTTERSNFSPAEVRMQRVDARRFTTTIGVAAGGLLRYEFTRGTYQTVERDRTGGIVAPHELRVVPDAHADDTVARWADSS